MTTYAFINAAEEMLDEELKGKWKVIQKIEKSHPEDSGGWFSTSYIVESLQDSKKKAFLKALNYRDAFNAPNFPEALQKMTTAFLFEREILEKCKEKKLRRIVTSIDHGDFSKEGSPYPTQYLIFELADGDIRQYLRLSNNLDQAWILKTIHQAASGLQQLHFNGIAHQDLKPSNVLTFNLDTTKLCDLGRSAIKGGNSPSDMFIVPGDVNYAPPEFLYSYIPNDWNARRYGYDIYTLGNLIVFLFTKSNITASIFQRLNPSLHYSRWTGTYSEVLPYIINAYNEVLQVFATELPSDLRTDVVDLVRQMCNPDPSKRGHIKNINSKYRQYSLEQFISKLDIMVKKVELGLWKVDS